MIIPFYICITLLQSACASSVPRSTKADKALRRARGVAHGRPSGYSRVDYGFFLLTIVVFFVAVCLLVRSVRVFLWTTVSGSSISTLLWTAIAHAKRLAHIIICAIRVTTRNSIMFNVSSSAIVIILIKSTIISVTIIINNIMTYHRYCDIYTQN